VVNIPHGKGTIHDKISRYYQSIDPNISGKQRVRDWLKGKSFQFQYDFGIEKLKEFGWYGQ